MKTGTVQNPKFMHLQQLLGSVPRWQAVGLLESMWMAVAQFKEHGGIGEWSNIQIAAAVDWRGDPDELICHLLAAGWLDEHPEFRLVVHDWHDHRPGYLLNRERQRRFRRSQTTSETLERDGRATVTLCGRDSDEGLTDGDAPTQPNRTQPNPTEQKRASPAVASPSSAGEARRWQAASGVKPDAGDALPDVLGTDAFKAAWAEWKQHRSEKGKTGQLTPTAIKRQLAKLAKLGPATAVEWIEHSVSNGYTGIFPPNPKGGINGTHRPNGQAPGPSPQTPTAQRATLTIHGKT